MENNIEKDVHAVLLGILQWFHEQCMKDGFRYYMVGGTMLGAVRHKGFIPWDDDIDVGMPRKDYLEFIRKYAHASCMPYQVECADNDNLDYRYRSAKIYDTSTTLIEHKRCRIKRGIYIDVFPLDGIGNTYETACKNFRPIYRSIHLHDMVTCAFRKGRKWHKNLSIILGRIISPLFISERRINYRINELCSRRDFDDFKYAGNLVGNWGIKEIMKRSYFGSPRPYSFEGLTILGVEKPHEYLSSLYGDYMKLPPMEKRVSHHDYVYLDLNKSYIK